MNKVTTNAVVMKQTKNKYLLFFLPDIKRFGIPTCTVQQRTLKSGMTFIKPLAFEKNPNVSITLT